MTIYKQRPASELPAKNGEYQTNLGVFDFIIDYGNIWVCPGQHNQMEQQYPDWWLEPIEPTDEISKLQEEIEARHVENKDAWEQVIKRTEKIEQLEQQVKTLSEAAKKACGIALQYHREEGNSPAANHMRNELLEALETINK